MPDRDLRTPVVLRPSMEASRAFKVVRISLLILSELLASFGLQEVVSVPSEGGIGGGVDIERDVLVSCM